MIATRLNVQEVRHSLARRIFLGQRGELRQGYREGMEDQLGALGLALNAVVLWNTLYIDAAVKHLRDHGEVAITDDSVRCSVRCPPVAGSHERSESTQRPYTERPRPLPSCLIGVCSVGSLRPIESLPSGVERAALRHQAGNPLQVRRCTHSATSAAAAGPVLGIGIPWVMRAGIQEYASTWRPVAWTIRTPVRPDSPSSRQ